VAKLLRPAAAPGVQLRPRPFVVVRFALAEKNHALVELCCHCDEEIDLDNDKYVIVTEANKAKGSVA
jgi:hypothetical protein